MRALLRKSVGRRSTPKDTRSTWRADFGKLLVCDNGLDNVPEVYKRGDKDTDGAYFVSQSRSPGHKNVGQDAMGLAQQGDFECAVLCDGHDRDGHLVARAVCRALPHIVLRRVSEREDPLDPHIDEQLLRDSFKETSDDECWTREGVHPGMFVKVFGGEWKDKVGYVGETKDDGTSIVIIVDDDGYHRPALSRALLRRAKFTGGCTCVCVVRHLKTGDVRVAIAGDSRALMLDRSAFEDPVWRPVFGVSDFSDGSVPPMGMTTPAHNVFNKDELLRLNTHHAGSFEIDGAFLVNPVTKFSIQPTRGFGDFDMYGTGYIDDPEVSGCFKLTPGSVLFVASDGVFDDHVWHDDELVSFFAEHVEKRTAMEKLGSILFEETLQRSLQGGYVDDISFYVLTGPEVTAEAGAAEGDSSAAASGDAASPSVAAPKRKSLMDTLLGAKKKADDEASEEDPRITTKPDVDAPTPEDRRKTIDRKGRGAFTELSSMLKDALSRRGSAEGDDAASGAAAASGAGDEGAADGDDDPEALANLVLERYATRYGLEPESVVLKHDASEAAAEAARGKKDGKKEGKKSGKKKKGGKK